MRKPKELLLEARPELAAQYHPDNTLPVEQVTLGMSEPRRWTCECGNDWWAAVNRRVKSKAAGMGCRPCTEKAAVPKRPLLTLRPELAAQYLPDNLIPIEKVSIKQALDAHWHCDTCDNEWYAMVYSRYNSPAAGMGCPKCAGKVITEDNSLLFNYPDIAAQYSTKNKKPIDQVTIGDSTSRLWECEHGHEWNNSPYNRVKQGDGCSKCGGRFPTEESNLAVVFPDVAAEFDYDANYPLTPYDFTPRSNKPVGWKCKKHGHTWTKSPGGRWKQGKLISCQECLTLPVMFPEIAAEYHPTLNTIPIEKVKSGSTIDRIWCCKKAGHVWTAQPAARTRKNRPTGCRDCSATPRTSKPEHALRITFITENILTDVAVKDNFKLEVYSGHHAQMEVDVFGYYNKQPIVIEYDSWWWHSGAGSNRPYSEPSERDIRKTEALLNAGYLVVRLREDRVDSALPLLNLEHSNLLQLHFNYLIHGTDFSTATQQVYKWLVTRRTRRADLKFVL